MITQDDNQLSSPAHLEDAPREIYDPPAIILVGNATDVILGQFLPGADLDLTFMNSGFEFQDDGEPGW